MPLFFRLCRVRDKPLRTLLLRTLAADIKAANRKRRADGLNRAAQAFLHSVVLDEHEGTAKRGIALLTRLYRAGVWADARTVNIIAAAALHKSRPVMAAALSFFMGQDGSGGGGDGDEDDAEDDSDSDGGGPSAAARRRSAEAQGAVGLRKEDVYRAYSKGTTASKKKKQHKLKREIAKAR